MNLCEMASSLQKNLHTFKSVQRIESNEITNLQQLHEADYVFSNLNPMDSPHLFKRYSYVWQDLIQQSVMADYIVHDSVGLSGVNAMRNYFRKFIKQEGCAYRLPEENYRQAEMDGIATVCAIFTPAFLPTCAVVYEEGCSFVKGRTRKEFICCTPNAFIRSEFTVFNICHCVVVEAEFIALVPNIIYLFFADITTKLVWHVTNAMRTSSQIIKTFL